MGVSKKMTYEEFSGNIAKLLKANPLGLVWTEIKEKLGLPQKVPNNRWVNRMKKDIGLVRKDDPKRGKVWRLE